MVDAIMQAWQLRVLRNGPRLISVLLAALIVAECLRAMLPLLSEHASRTLPPALVGRLAQHPHSSGLDVRPIVSAHLFGVAAEDLQDAAHASPTTANLVLQGTVATRDPKEGVAIIVGGSPAKVYRVGDDVEGASLHSVYLDHVILDRSGRLETLSLPRLQLAAGDASHQSVLDGALSPAATKGHTLADVIRAEPSLDGQTDSLQGFRVRPGRAPSSFIRSGLRPGDLVTAVNGTPLADQNRHRGQEIVDTMLASGSATVSVVRNGRPVEVSVESPQ
jgi:general secretion pathway protein C